MSGAPTLAYTDRRGRIYFDPRSLPLADGGIVRPPDTAELIPAPEGTVAAMLPGREPLVSRGRARGRTALSAILPAGYTRLCVPAYREAADAPALPLYGYTFACAVDDELHVAAVRTDEDPDWLPRSFAAGELEGIVATRLASDPANCALAQLGVCALEYGCFTAQNVFLRRGEAALPVSPTCNARCAGCISELDAGAGIPSPQRRIGFEPDVAELVRIALEHLEREPGGIVSFGQGCEGEPLLRASAIARVIEGVRARRRGGIVNLNTNGSLPKALRTVIDSGLQAIRVSLNSFRPAVYGAYYRPLGYGLEEVLESIALASTAGLRVSLNLLTHPGVTDDVAEIEALERFVGAVRVDMIQTRTLNVDPHRYFDRVGRPGQPIGMRAALGRIAAAGVRVGNFTHVH